MLFVDNVINKLNNKQRFYRQTQLYQKQKGSKSLRRHHLIDKDNPFSELYYWAREVRIRDNHKCVQCGRSRHLTAHHLFNKFKYPLLKYNISNGISLCFNCHIELHKLNE